MAAVETPTHHDELAGLDALETELDTRPSLGRRLWSTAWPKLLALAIVLVGWQLLVWLGWKKEYVLPPPRVVFDELRTLVTTGRFWEAVGRTMRRALTGFAISVVLGSIVGLAVARFSVLRRAIGSLITGLQTMPSIAWFPAAILLFKLSETAIMFVVVLGAAPSIANGLIGGVDHVPPILVRAGRVLGARGFGLYRSVVLPAVVPSYMAGLKQGWAFAWRSLMAGELLSSSLGASIGTGLSNARELADGPQLYAWMVVILVIGIGVDAVFGAADRAIRRRYGLLADR